MIHEPKSLELREPESASRFIWIILWVFVEPAYFPVGKCSHLFAMAVVLLTVLSGRAYGDAILSDTVTINIKGVNAGNNKPDTLTMTLSMAVTMLPLREDASLLMTSRRLRSRCCLLCGVEEAGSKEVWPECWLRPRRK
jgi:hypothetical protein